MTTKLENLEAAVNNVLGERILEAKLALGELTIVVSPSNYLQAMRQMVHTNRAISLFLSQFERDVASAFIPF